jgi:hypothetical protein
MFVSDRDWPISRDDMTRRRVMAYRFTGPLARAFAPRLGADPTAALGGLLAPPDRALPVAPATDRRVWDPADGSADGPALRDLVARARADLGTPWPTPLASTAARVHRDGERDTHEQLVFARQRRLSRAAVAAAAAWGTPSADRWLDEVADGVWLLCEQSSWCWPAHDDTLRAHGSVLPTVDDPFLDLGAGEVVGQLAWLDQLLGAGLDERYPGLRARVRAETRRRVVDPFTRRRDWHWIGLDGDVHNWSPWIHGTVLVAALRLLDGPRDAPLRAHVVDLALEGIDRYVAALPEDGATDEGYAYWWNGACRALEALDVLAHATGGALDALGGPHTVGSLRATVAFPHRMHLGGEWYLNVADGQARPPAAQPWHALHRAARRAGDAAAAAHAASYRRPAKPAADETEGLGRLLRGITDGAWVAAAPTAPPLVRDAWLGSTQLAVARPAAGSRAGLTLAVKGGHNGEHHNHADVGEVVVASDGVPVLVDAGRPTYTAQTFGPDRYALWMMQSAWHTVPQVRGTVQGVGARFAAAGVDHRADADATTVTLELAGAYPEAAGLRSWRREARLERGTGRVVVRDAWDLDPWRAAGPEPGTAVHVLLAGRVRLAAGGAVVEPLDGARPVRLGWGPAATATLTARPLDDPMLSGVWGTDLTRLELDVTGARELTLVVEQLAPAQLTSAHLTPEQRGDAPGRHADTRTGAHGAVATGSMDPEEDA